MDAIYRVDGDRVHVSPNAAGPWDGGMHIAAGTASEAPAQHLERRARDVRRDEFASGCGTDITIY
jgi:hypothetical protein